MDSWRARDLHREYLKLINAGEGTEVDIETAAGLEALGKGLKVVNLREAIVAGGFDDRCRPRIAIARASWQYCHHTWTFPRASPMHYFTETSWGDGRRAKLRIAGTPLPANASNIAINRAVVPTIPPRFRPASGNLARYVILWEANWDEAPVDPALLRPLGKKGWLAVLLATWDLTDLERSVLSSSIHE